MERSTLIASGALWLSPALGGALARL